MFETKVTRPSVARSGERRGRAHFERRRLGGGEQRAPGRRGRRQWQHGHGQGWKQVGQCRQLGSEMRFAALLEVTQPRFQLARMLANAAVATLVCAMTAAGDGRGNCRQDRAGDRQRQKRRRGPTRNPVQKLEHAVLLALVRLQVKAMYSRSRLQARAGRTRRAGRTGLPSARDPGAQRSL